MNVKIKLIGIGVLFFTGQALTAQETKKTEKVQDIEGVVVTALGIKREKKALGYAAQTVKSDEIIKSGKNNVMDALNGKVSGVQITNSGGQAGTGTSVIIRGFTSITGNNQPLYVVDGVPIDNGTVNTDPDSPLSGTPTTNRAADLSSDDIETVSILKGGAASALYGVRAANGAVIITTKKGKSGNMVVEFSTNQSFEMGNKYPEFSDKFTVGSNGVFNDVTTNQWGPAANSGAVYPSGVWRDINGDGVLEDLSGKPIVVYKDNFKRFFKTGNTSKYAVSVSGGDDKSNFMLGASHLEQNGLIPNQKYRKNSILLNVGHKFNEKFDVDGKVNFLNTGGFYFDNAKIGDNLGYFNNIYDVVNYPYQDALGNRTYWHPNLSHPMWIVNKTGEDRNNNRFIANLGFNYKITPKLVLSYKAGLDTYNEYRKNYNSIGTAEFVDTDYKGDLRELRITNTDINSDLFLRFDTNISKDWKVNLMVGNNYYHKKFDRSRVIGTSFILPDLLDINNTVEKTNTHYSYDKETIGLFGEAGVSFRNMLFLTATGRNDWYSTLPRIKYDFFYPSFSGSFVFSELMNSSDFYGKIRGSFARTANAPEVYSLQTTYDKRSINFFGNPAYSLSDTRLNPSLRPETTKLWEVGVELGVLKNKIFFDGTYYNKTSYDQIIYAPVSVVSGFSEALMNVGEINNKGVEATLRFTDLIKTEGLTWTTEFNFTKNVGKVVKVGDDGQDQVSLAGGYWSTAEIIAKKGEALGNIYGYTYKHLDPNNPNSPIVVNAAGVPQLSSEKTLIGNINPDFILGWNTSLAYKGLRFGFTLERKQGGQLFNDYAVENVYSGHSPITDNRYYTGNANVNATQNFNGVSASGTPVNVAAQLTKTFYTGTYRRNDQNFVEDASWWRLRNIYIGYALPKEFIKRKMGIQSLEITFSARNAWLKTPYSGVDPEVNSLGVGSNGGGIGGIDANSFPNTKSFDLGVKIKL